MIKSYLTDLGARLLTALCKIGWHRKVKVVGLKPWCRHCGQTTQ